MGKSRVRVVWCALGELNRPIHSMTTPTQLAQLLLLIYVCITYENGVDLNQKLLAACGDKDAKISLVKSLLVDGAAATAASAEGETALHLACIWGHSEVIEVLLNAGANPNSRAWAKKSLEMTPLTWCAY